nr:V-type proton ATPase subunit C 1-B-like [Parasteatoda tepidariorum]
MNESEKPAESEKQNDEEVNNDYARDSMMSESVQLLANEEKNDSEDDESKQLLVNEEGNDEESSKFQSDEKVKDDGRLPVKDARDDDDARDSMMSDSVQLLANEEENDAEEEEDESKQLLVNEEGNDEESSKFQSDEKVKDDGGLSEKDKTHDPHYISFKNERKILTKQEEALEALKDIENEIQSQFGVHPCESCEFLDPFKELKITLCCGLCTRTFSRFGDIRELWIVSAPGNETPHDTFLKLIAVTQDKRLSKNYKFHIPDLKIGTMDELIKLIEELFNGDKFGEETLQSFMRCMTTIVGSKRGAMKHLLVNQLDLATYLTRFTWNGDKYPVDQSLRDTFITLSKIVRQTAAGLKARDNEVSYIVKIFEKIKRDRESSLLTRPLDKFVKKKDLVTGSTYFITLLVVVAKEQVQNWLQTYETLTEWVVPQSSKKLFSDESYSLFTVVVIKKFANDFESAARDKKFNVRRFNVSHDADEELEDIYMRKLKQVKKAIFGASYRWVKTNFSECFVAWIHIKALRVFTESALRYGIPVNFQATLMIPIHSKKAKLAIDGLYVDLEAYRDSEILQEEIPGVLNRYGVSQYLPYVFVTINTDFLGAKDDL